MLNCCVALCVALIVCALSLSVCARALVAPEDPTSFHLNLSPRVSACAMWLCVLFGVSLQYKMDP